MTDNDITKAKEHFTYGITHDIFSEPVTSYAKTALWAFEEVNSQKAEIERLTSGKCIYLSDDETTEYCFEGPCQAHETKAMIRAEAIKEFWNQRPPHLSVAKKR